MKRAFGRGIAFLFAWARMTVIQTGSIALLAFVFGDYASQIWRLGTFSPSIYAAIAIALLTALNIVGLQQGKWTQNLLSAAKVLGLLLVVVIRLTAIPNTTAPVFWFFFLLSGISLLVLRQREPQIRRSFRVPLYPFTPLLFCAVCAYLLYSSLVYTGVGAMVGVVVVVAGIPLLL